MLTAPGEIYPRKLSVYRVGQKSLQRLPPENIRLKTDKMNGKIVPQREHRLQTYWFLKLTEMLTAPGEIYPRKLSLYGVGQKRRQISRQTLKSALESSKRGGLGLLSKIL